MVVDSSAVVAILLQEAECERFSRKILRSATRCISAANHVEVALKIDRVGDAAARAALDELLAVLDVGIEPVTVEQARIARSANQRFGRGSGHPARLNYGDLFAYALAMAREEPLLFKGDDFTHTDVRIA